MTAADAAERRQPKRSRFEAAAVATTLKMISALPIPTEVVANLVTASINGVADVDLTDATKLITKRPRRRSVDAKNSEGNRSRGERQPPRDPRARHSLQLPNQPVPTYHLFTGEFAVETFLLVAF